MPATIDYYFSVSSPWAYLGAPRLIAMAAQHGVRIDPVPIALITENGGISIRTRPEARRAYWFHDLARCAAHLGMPVLLEERPPLQDAGKASPMLVAAQRLGLDATALGFALQRGYWAQGRDISDPAVRAAIAGEAGFDTAALLAAEAEPETERQWQANLDRAKAAGVFGVPSYCLDGELFWGQDRLNYLDRRLRGAA
ncbi:2-hydroxychromene-2-carboxylate isomerase [Roseomonas sp. JC162]|uniref:2-hydroxychromene-2-carboxylate isomerase n=1 Tax=Neoroseomonas marina TaxID=1232220 RepID=A0A848EAN4_9PROT|nr:2-hydroxychromene-2-carboxylate isomerase [Neoroseomonas marina]NMJ41564.1 2-hydroxychromene-2-carboxylate isomerase [Neoroseomonas marina]